MKDNSDDILDEKLAPIYGLIDYAEERDPEFAAHLAKEMGLKLLRKWSDINERNKKMEKLKDVDNLN